MNSLCFRVALTALAAATMSANAGAATPADIAAALAKSSRESDPGFAGFSATRGEHFFRTRHGDWSCATCHTDDPLAAGRHTVTGRTIAPLSPVANPERFTDPAKVDKWFRRNCNDVVGRACTAQEKGDVLSWLVGLRK